MGGHIVRQGGGKGKANHASGNSKPQNSSFVSSSAEHGFASDRSQVPPRDTHVLGLDRDSCHKLWNLDRSFLCACVSMSFPWAQERYAIKREETCTVLNNSTCQHYVVGRSSLCKLNVVKGTRKHCGITLGTV